MQKLYSNELSSANMLVTLRRCLERKMTAKDRDHDASAELGARLSSAPRSGGRISENPMARHVGCPWGSNRNTDWTQHLPANCSKLISCLYISPIEE